MDLPQNLSLWSDMLTDETSDNADIAGKVNYLQTLPGGSSGYRLRRIILCNFWLYGIQEFEIPHGRLFLAGENASGKSSVLAAALPLALDGNLSPNRLDTFGTRQRKIDYYVLGSAESSTPYLYERRTTYIALEFEWCDQLQPPFAPDIRQRWLEARQPQERERARWLTIGLSLAGNVNANESVRPLRFLITDGSRIGYDMRLVDQKNVAYDQPAFKRLLGENSRGIICDTVADYQSHVARYLFNINDVRDFQNIISMLLVIRQPNLGTEINFTKVHDYLKQALPRIPDEISRRVTGTLERIDTIQNQLEHLQEAHAAAVALDKAAQKLAFAGARKAGLTYLKARNSEHSFQGRVTALEKEQIAAQGELEKATTEYNSLNQENAEITGQLAALEKNETLQLVEKITLATLAAELAQTRLTTQTTQLENLQKARELATTRKERLVGRWQTWLGDIRNRLEVLGKRAQEEARWELAAQELAGITQQVTTYTLESPSPPVIPQILITLADTLCNDRIQKLNYLEKLYREREQLEINVRIASERTSERHTSYDVIRRKREEAGEVVALTRETLTKEWRRIQRTSGSWLAEFPDYRLAEVVTALLRASLTDYQTLTHTVSEEISRAIAREDEIYSKLLQEIGAKKSGLINLEKTYEAKLNEPERLPWRTERRRAARKLLTEHNIEAYPLYALVDFHSELTLEQAGQIEQLLEDAALLDALVVRPVDTDQAYKILTAHSLSDTFLLISPLSPTLLERMDKDRELVNSSHVSIGTSSLASWLKFDQLCQTSNLAQWQGLVESILQELPIDAPADTDAGQLVSWKQGILTGQVGIASPPGYIGIANRKRLRDEELLKLQSTLEQVRAERAELESRHKTSLATRQSLREEYASLESLGQARDVATAEAELVRCETERIQAERTLQEAQLVEREARQNFNKLSAQILQETIDLATARDTTSVRAILEATRKLQTELEFVQRVLDSGIQQQTEFEEVSGSLTIARQNEKVASQLYLESQAQTTQALAELAELEKVARTADVQAVVERVTYLRNRKESLPIQLQTAAVRRGQNEERLRNLSEILANAQENLEEARTRRMATQTTFSLKLAFYPVIVLVEARNLSERGDTPKAAQLLLLRSSQADLAEQELDREEVAGGKLPNEDELEAEYNRIVSQLLAEFNNQRSFLAEYGPELDEESQIIFIAQDHIELPALINLLTTQIELQRTLLDKEERVLFEDFLLQEMAEAIRLHISEANQWVTTINLVLHDLPMVGERYSLEWKALEANEISEGYGNHIARYHRFLSKQASQLSAEESQLILDALRREIASLRLRQKDDPGLNFMEALVQIFDYREWFRFGVFITPEGGQRIRLTDRNAGSRSGAEQLFALYVPLFAALAALYTSRAGKGSPRLLALDEAFDKASLANTQKIMQFLVLQDFQWIMTGPQVSGIGSGVPVSAEYQMLHEKGTKLATAVPYYWINEQAQHKQEQGDRHKPLTSEK